MQLYIPRWLSRSQLLPRSTGSHLHFSLQIARRENNDANFPVFAFRTATRVISVFAPKKCESMEARLIWKKCRQSCPCTESEWGVKDNGLFARNRREEKRNESHGHNFFPTLYYYTTTTIQQDSTNVWSQHPDGRSPEFLCVCFSVHVRWAAHEHVKSNRLFPLHLKMLGSFGGIFIDANAAGSKRHSKVG